MKTRANSLDASVLADFLLGRPQAISLLGQAMSGHEHELIHAPELFELEVLNAMRRLAYGKTISDRQAGMAIEDLASVRIAHHPHAPLRARIWELRDNLTAYDAAYLALAEVLDDPVLLTGDDGLASVARTSLGSDRVLQMEI
ncbi:MAG TPA: type II toxin-antitoxin system VapC family toxin [Solirubrobacteraceae bacterium]|nr:type II toxin-antitoxin system VapC family toxin [Solirubrobacteraceae bacterium]